MTRFVVTGTDTGIGKTVFSAALAGAMEAHYWKPIQSGRDDGADHDVVIQMGGVPAERVLPEAYFLETPCSPHRAAEIDGVAIDLSRLALPEISPLVVEGAGGALVPITRNTTYADVFAWWNIPAIIVARTSLGTINHTLLTIEALRSRAVPIHGVAFVGDEVADSQMTICAMGNVRNLGRLPRLDSLTRDSLTAAFAKNFDVADFA
ncbi:dethiobiotin synthase [Novosphingobium olei]|uniref:dethiobiotin synthase n=1 Tax=Novosphingobium olei TaxID=2728851 RepID=UPI00308F6F13|nr:dethiobiotin synthase [Novosphingobium olei]